MSAGMSSPTGAGVYEQWVTTLRVWGKDPENTSLRSLPTLTDETFTPDTYARLVDHLLRAMREAHGRWQSGLERAFATAATPHALARELVALRVLLGRRLQLAQHPGLPEPIRTSLVEGLTRDIERYQSDAEAAIGRQQSAASIDTTFRDQMLQVVRENSFVAVLGYDTSGDRPELGALPVNAAPSSAQLTPRSTRRRVVPFTTQSEVSPQ